MIEFKNIQIKYGDFTAIDNLNLTVGDGEFFTFLGPSGCGKTTTLRALVGFLTPSSGQILLDGKDLVQVPVEKRGIGMVFQSYALFPTMTVYENLAFGLKVKKMSPSEIDRKVREVAKVIAIKDDQLVRNVSELSGGQQQRVALARAIVLEPKILCLDEPLSNLDAKLRISLRSELKRLQKNLGITTLYVTHDQEEALMLSDKIAVFNNGFVEQVGNAAGDLQPFQNRICLRFHRRYQQAGEIGDFPAQSGRSDAGRGKTRLYPSGADPFQPGAGLLKDYRRGDGFRLQRSYHQISGQYLRRSDPGDQGKRRASHLPDRRADRHVSESGRYHAVLRRCRI